MVSLDPSPVSSNPGFLGGTVVFRGPRVPVQTFVDYLADGYSLEEFLEFFPPSNELTPKPSCNCSAAPREDLARRKRPASPDALSLWARGVHSSKLRLGRPYVSGSISPAAITKNPSR